MNMNNDSSVQLSINSLTQSADWFVHNVDANMQATLYPMTAASYNASIFLDSRIALQPGAGTTMLNFKDLCGLFPNVAAQQTRYLFHISHVGSTLISRLLGCKMQVLSLREPILLRWMSGFKTLLDKPESRIDTATYQAFLAATQGLLSRPLGIADQVIVKATSFTNNIAQDMLTMQPEARAVGIYSRLDAFVATILKGTSGWSDISELCSIRLKRLHDLLGREPWQLSQMGPGEIAAMSWLAEMATLSQAASAHGSRYIWFDFDAYLAKPNEHFSDLCHHLKLNWTDQNNRAVEESGLSSRYSKDSNVTFGSENRQMLITNIISHHSTEISKARNWVERAVSIHPELANLNAFI